MRIKFIKDYPYKPKPTVTRLFKKGMVATLTKENAEAMIAKGVAEEVNDTNRPKRATTSAAK